MEDFDDHSLQESSIDIIENVSDIVPNHFSCKICQRLFFFNALLNIYVPIKLGVLERSRIL